MVRRFDRLDGYSGRYGLESGKKIRGTVLVLVTVMASEIREDQIALAEAAFRRELPTLLKSHAGQWVAYRGSRCMGFAETKTDMYESCLESGLSRGEFLVRSVEPDMDEMFLGPSN
jgi:hypothetical protein